MQGYCPTRANQAPAKAPREPVVAWFTAPFPIDTPEDFLPPEVVVDAARRAYVARNASPENPGNRPNTLLAVDPDGTVAWSTTFSSSITSLTLASDGLLWLMGTQRAPIDAVACPGRLLHAALLGVSVSLSAVTRLAVAGDGTAVVLVGDDSSGAAGSQSRVQLIAVQPSGAIHWSVSRDLTKPLDDYGLFIDAAQTVILTAGTLDGIDLET